MSSPAEATAFRGYVGDRASYADFEFGDDLSWHFDLAASVPINTKGAVKGGHAIDGAIVDERTEAGQFAWPPVVVDDHAWNALQGWAPAGDDRWVLNLIDRRHRTSLASDVGSPCKNMGWSG